MISLCSVLIEECLPCLDNFLENASMLQGVDEVILCKTDNEPSQDRTWKAGDKQVTLFAYPTNLYLANKGRRLADTSPDLIHSSCGHALGLRACINRAKNDLVLISDNDLFYYPGTAEFYAQMLDKFDLSFVGAAHPLEKDMAFRYFPNIVSMMFRKTSLPDESFMRDWLESYPMWADGTASIPGEFIVPGKNPSYVDEFPNPTGLFDTGSYLMLWAKQKNLNWMSFMPDGPHLYWNKIYRSNLPIKERFRPAKLVWHMGGGSWSKVYWDDYVNAYREFLELLS